jgi:ribonucleoside-diphosphate reductase alpha chain
MGTTEKEVKVASTEQSKPAGKGLRGLTITRMYSDASVSPYDAIEWELRTAAITSEKGEVIFEQKNVEMPRSWSQTATNIVVQKYFHGRVGQPERETSVRQLIERVAATITGYGEKGGYFKTAADRDAFHDELAAILVNQVASFNSPVWFNVGIEPKPQGSACFINSCGDSMDSILTLAKTEGMLFKFGSGTGSNLSNLRGAHEGLSAGGTASGPLSFMKGFDSFAGAIKSGGKTRRAAKMVILNIDHPDIDEFILSKAKEERKAWALIDAGYDGSFNGEAYSSIFYQNANHSVRVTDQFMKAVEEDGDWETKEVLTGKPYKKYKARKLMSDIAEAAWVCGDPGMQYDTTINKWNPVKQTHRINASNPCSEFMFIDDSSCNLASLNLMKFFNHDDGSFNVDAFRHACDIVISAQEMLVDNCSYPTKKIEENSYKFRPLGLGYANLGALLMATGLPYDSDEGRAYSAAITSLMSAEAYLQSSKIAAELGPFAGYEPNKDAFLEVIDMHREAAYKVLGKGVPADLVKAQKAVWDAALESGKEFGYKNGQVTVLAPTGTIGFMMDCDTTGVEPDLALVKYKKLVGGGMIKIVNNTVPLALKRLDYSEQEAADIVAYVDEKGTIEGALGFKAEHLPVFDCAFRALNGTRSIHYSGHIRMMGAVQPFLSGAISKTVNMPADATPEEIAGVYVDGWKHGLKAIAIYRDGCKRTQPLNTAASKSDAKSPEKRTSLEFERGALRSPDSPLYVGKAVAPTPAPFRRKLPDERRSITHKFSVAGHEGYVTVGLFEDGKPGEIFLRMSKEGSTISGLMDSFATAVSLTLQYGVPLEALVNKFTHMRFEPSGFTKNPEIPIAKSLVDYIFRWMGSKFLSPEEREAIGVINRSNGFEAPTPVTEQSVAARAHGGPTAVPSPGGEKSNLLTFETSTDAPACHECGSIMVRSGACYRCMNCGATSGCS